MLAAEPRADRVLLERIVDRRFGLEEVFQRRPMRADELPQGVGFDDLSDAHDGTPPRVSIRSEEHTSELQSLMRISYSVFCLKKKRHANTTHPHHYTTNATVTAQEPIRK